MIYAVYRCLYGQDFARQSILSVEPFVDRVFVFWDSKPWGDVSEVLYKGEWLPIPSQPDNVLEVLYDLRDELPPNKLVLHHDHVRDNRGQFTHLVNERILRNFPSPDVLMMVEIDHVWRSDQLEQALHEFESQPFDCCTSSQVVMWRDLNWRVFYQQPRLASMFWRLDGRPMPMTGRHADVRDRGRLSAYVHNMGFCISPEVMKWKHLIALAMSQKIGDSMPAEDWYDRWLNWEPGMKNLEPSAKHSHFIPEAVPYDRETCGNLPEVLVADDD